MEPHDHPHPHGHPHGEGHDHEHQDKRSFAEPSHHEEPKTEPQVVREVHHHHHERRRGFPGHARSLPRAGSVWRLAIGCIVILIGFSFLADQLGWDVSFEFWKFWPVFIILIGLSMLGRGSWMNTVLGILIGLAVIGIIIAGIFGTFSSTDTDVTTGNATIAKEATATDADVSLSFGAGTLRVTGGDQDLLSYAYALKNGTFTATSELQNTTQNVDLETEHKRWMFSGWGKNELSVKLSNTVPLTLFVDGGAADMTLDLTGVLAKRVDIDTGATKLALTLSDVQDGSDVSIDAGASTMNITIPRELGVRLSLDTGLTSKTLTDFTEASEGVYESANYGTATKKATLSIDAGASTINVAWR